MNRNGRKHTFWYVRPTKIQIRLRIRAVWSEPSLSISRKFASVYSKCTQWRFWSDCANAQSDLNLRWGTCLKVRFLTLRINSSSKPFETFTCNEQYNICLFDTRNSLGHTHTYFGVGGNHHITFFTLQLFKLLKSFLCILYLWKHV